MIKQRLEENHWRVDTKDFPAERKSDVWKMAMQKIFLAAQYSEEKSLSGEITYFKSHMGVDFVNLAGSPQTLTGNYPSASESLWLAILIKGESLLEINRDHLDFSIGSILYGSCSNIDHICLEMGTDFKILTIEIPNTAFYKRLVNPLSIRAGVLRSENGVSRVLYAFLEAVSNEMEHLTPSSFRSLDSALTELFLTSLAEHISLNNFSNYANAHAFQRLCDSIEQHISDESLNLGKLGLLNNVSERYIQKIFQEAGLKFSNYVRERRIDLCKRDLANPNYRGLSISEICFRWGFSDIAYFSRVFSQKIGVSPRVYREQARKID